MITTEAKMSPFAAMFTRFCCVLSVELRTTGAAVVLGTTSTSVAGIHDGLPKLPLVSAVSCTTTSAAAVFNQFVTVSGVIGGRDSDIRRGSRIGLSVSVGGNRRAFRRVIVVAGTIRDVDRGVDGPREPLL